MLSLSTNIHTARRPSECNKKSNNFHSRNRYKVVSRPLDKHVGTTGLKEMIQCLKTLRFILQDSTTKPKKAKDVSRSAKDNF